MGRKWTYQTYPTLVDYLDCPRLITTPPPNYKMTFAAWVQMPTDVQQASYGIWITYGAWLSAGVSTGGTQCNLSLYRGIFGDYQAVSPNYTTLGLGDFAGQPVFIACSSNGTGISFFAGLTPSTIVPWGVDIYGPSWQVFTDVNSLIGATAGSVSQWYGTVSQAALWWGKQLTLGELQDFAGSCSLKTPLTDLATFYYPIVGASPETDYSLGGNDAVVNGTTVVSSICIPRFGDELIAEFI